MKSALWLRSLVLSMHLYHLNSKKGLTCFNGVYLTKNKKKSENLFFLWNKAEENQSYLFNQAF